MNFDKETKSEFFFFFFFFGGGGGGGGGGGEEKCSKIQKSNHLHTVEHVVQSTFQNMLITFYAQTLQLLFEFSSK